MSLRVGWAGSSVLTIVTVASSACVHYAAKPLDVTRVFDRLDSRTLADPDLARVAESAHLSSAWPPAEWDVQALTVAALYFHPDLAVARASWGVARAGIVTAGARPELGVAVGPGFNSSTPAHTVTPWIFNLDLDFTIETAGKRGLRVDQATRLADSARYQIASTAWQARMRVRQALLDLFAATEAAKILDRQRTIQEANFALFQRQLDAGEISALQISQVRLLLSGARLALFDAQRQQQDARARLAAAVGVPLDALEGTRLGLEGFTRGVADLPDTAARRQALTNRADVLSALADYEASEAALQLEIAKQYPDVHLGPGYQMDQNSNKWSLLFPLTLPVFNRNRGPIAEADARRTLAASQVEAIQARAIGAVDRALAAYRSALDKVTLADQLIAEVQQVAQTAERQLAAGAISQLDLGIVQVELGSHELSRLEALVQVQQALGDIEDAMQRPVDLPLDPIARVP